MTQIEALVKLSQLMTLETHMPTNSLTGLTEPDITVNGVLLTYAEAMTLRVALTSFRISLSDPPMRAGLGERLAAGYDNHASRVEFLMLSNGDTFSNTVE